MRAVRIAVSSDSLWVIHSHDDHLALPVSMPEAPVLTRPLLWTAGHGRGRWGRPDSRPSTVVPASREPFAMSYSADGFYRDSAASGLHSSPT